MAPEFYVKYVVYDNRRKILYAVLLRDMYRVLFTYLLWYNKYHSDLEAIGFEFNPYVTFVVKNGKQERTHCNVSC